MIRYLLLFILFVAVQSGLQAQPVHDGTPLDSTSFTFEQFDSLTRPVKKETVDTTGALLWKIGTTSKTFFAAGATSSYAIMTDTSNPYPLNANDWFTLKIENSFLFNVIISFRHKYQTTAQHDGGIVEYSVDSFNWLNVSDSCNADSNFGQGITTQNFYSPNDTLLDGTPAFSGTSNGWQYSRFQFFFGLPLKGTASPCLPSNVVHIRFRFVSDDTLESLDGWIIDDLKIERDDYGSAVKERTLIDGVTIYPNPASEQLTIVDNHRLYRQAVINNSLGQVVQQLETAGSITQVNIKELPRGIYFIQLKGPAATTTRKIQIQ